MCVGLNFYGVNQTTGELVTLVTDLAMGEGQDVTLPPGTLMSVKVKVHSKRWYRVASII